MNYIVVNSAKRLNDCLRLMYANDIRHFAVRQKDEKGNVVYQIYIQAPKEVFERMDTMWRKFIE